MATQILILFELSSNIFFSFEMKYMIIFGFFHNYVLFTCSSLQPISSITLFNSPARMSAFILAKEGLTKQARTSTLIVAMSKSKKKRITRELFIYFFNCNLFKIMSILFFLDFFFCIVSYIERSNLRKLVKNKKKY